MIALSISINVRVLSLHHKGVWRKVSTHRTQKTIAHTCTCPSVQVLVVDLGSDSQGPSSSEGRHRSTASTPPVMTNDKSEAAGKASCDDT